MAAPPITTTPPTTVAHCVCVSAFYYSFSISTVFKAGKLSDKMTKPALAPFLNELMSQIITICSCFYDMHIIRMYQYENAG